ncbi:TetR family transcriptional regulator, partial [Streptomyces koyangensis]
QRRGELPYEAEPAVAEQHADLIFDVIAGAVVHRALVSDGPVDEAWAQALAGLLIAGLPAAMT